MSVQEVVSSLVKQDVLVTAKQLQQLQARTDQELQLIEKRILQGQTNLQTLLHPSTSNVRVKFSYNKKHIKKKEVADFVSYFNHRYKALSSILRRRQELQDVLSLSRIAAKNKSEKVAMIGMINDIRETKNGHLLVTLEDPTGLLRIIFMKNKQPLLDQAKDLVPDEVIGVRGTNKENVVFADQLFWPDVPINKELKKSPDVAYSAFISDVHVGSKEFLKEKFERFISWLNKEEVSEEHKEIVDNLQYLFISGDLVAGVGVYPGQEEELTIPSIYDQYEQFAQYIRKIPEHIHIIICPGNHDAGRLSEPQPPISVEVAPSLHEFSNVTLVSNPSLVTIHEQPGFPGFDMFIYHGYSFSYYVANVDSIRNNGGYHRADLIMQFLLKRRHVCPAHTSSLYVPDNTEDPLVITTVPDFFISGDIHYTSVGNYNNITLICGSCWEGITAFQIKLGHDPEPARVPIVNLHTREVTILEF